jgi:predicted Zn-dependent peptidase
VRAFYQAHVRPAVATAVVVGDLTGIDLDAVLAGTLGGWTGDAAGPVHVPPVTAGDTGRVVIVDRPGAVQTQLLIGRTGPDRHDQVWPALLLGTYCLGGTLTSRLDRVLREEKGYTYGVRAFQRVLRVCHCSPSAVLSTRPPPAPRWTTCGRCWARWPRKG